VDPEPVWRLCGPRTGLDAEVVWTQNWFGGGGGCLDLEPVW
jgi:hypothetical protein